MSLNRIIRTKIRVIERGTRVRNSVNVAVERIDEYERGVRGLSVSSFREDEPKRKVIIGDFLANPTSDA